MRRTKNTVADLLFHNGDQFQFHAAMKVLQAIVPSYSDAEQKPYDAKAAVIKVYPSFRMPGTDLNAILPPNNERRVPEVQINFFGIETRQGPLPDPYIIQLVESYMRGDKAFHDFLSLFNNRLAHLLHEIRAKYHVGIVSKTPDETPYGVVLRSLLGLNNPFLKNRFAHVPDRSLFYIAGLLNCRPLSKEALLKTVRYFFQVPANLQENQGAWTAIPSEKRTYIGKAGRFHILGKNTILGQCFWADQKSVQLILGPLSFKQFQSFLPNGVAYGALTSLLYYMVGANFLYSVGLIVHKEEIPRTILRHTNSTSLLGWTTWLCTKKTPAKDQWVTLNLKTGFAVA